MTVKRSTASKVDVDKLTASLQLRIDEIVGRMNSNNMEHLVRLLESTRARTLMDIVEILNQQKDK